MTDNEIIKALDSLHKRILRSNFAREVTENEVMAIVDALSLINRQKEENENYSHNIRTMADSIREWQKNAEKQKAEIERLTAERDEARQDCAVAERNHQLAVAEREANVKGFTETLKTAKVDAIKEFVEMIVKDYPEMEFYLDILIKDLAGDGDGSV